MHAENRLPALFFVEAEGVGSDRVNLLGTQNNMDVLGCGDRRKTFMARSLKAYG